MSENLTWRDAGYVYRCNSRRKRIPNTHKGGRVTYKSRNGCKPGHGVRMSTRRGMRDINLYAGLSCSRADDKAPVHIWEGDGHVLGAAFEVVDMTAATACSGGHGIGQPTAQTKESQTNVIVRRAAGERGTGRCSAAGGACLVILPFSLPDFPEIPPFTRFLTSPTIFASALLHFLCPSMECMTTVLIFCLSCSFLQCCTALPLLADEELGETSTTSPAVVSIEVKIKKATDTIDNLNKNIIDSLAGTIDNDALSPIGTYADAESLVNSTSNFTAANASSVTLSSTQTAQTNNSSVNLGLKQQENATSAQNTDQKFSTVLKDLQEFEEHLMDSIRNFTATRQYAYRTMLRPMLQQVQQLRSNLTHLRNHMIGFHAVTELQQQVNALTTELGDVITSGRPEPSAEIQAEADSVRPLQESLAWVSD